MKSTLAAVKRQRFPSQASRRVRGLFILSLGSQPNQSCEKIKNNYYFTSRSFRSTTASCCWAAPSSTLCPALGTTSPWSSTQGTPFDLWSRNPANLLGLTIASVHHVKGHRYNIG